MADRPSSTTCAGASAQIHIPLELETRLKSILAIFIMALLCALPESARADVFQQPDTSSEDRAGFALIGANLVLAAQIGRHLQQDIPVKTWGWVGVGAGTASIALGATETTSFSAGVTVAGALVTVLGAMQLVHDSDATEPQGRSDVSSHSLSFAPLMTSSEKSGCGIGILTRLAF